MRQGHAIGAGPQPLVGFRAYRNLFPRNQVALRILDSDHGARRPNRRIWRQGHRRSVIVDRCIRPCLLADPTCHVGHAELLEPPGHFGQKLIRANLLFDARKSGKLDGIVTGFNRVHRILILHLNGQHPKKGHVVGTDLGA